MLHLLLLPKLIRLPLLVLLVSLLPSRSRWYMRRLNLRLLFLLWILVLPLFLLWLLEIPAVRINLLSVPSMSASGAFEKGCGAFRGTDFDASFGCGADSGGFGITGVEALGWGARSGVDLSRMFLRGDSQTSILLVLLPMAGHLSSSFSSVITRETPVG